VIGGETPVGGIGCEVSPHLMQLRVEVVDRRQDQRLGRHRLDGRTQLARAMVRQDQVLDLESQFRRHVRMVGKRLAEHRGAEHDVTDQIAFHRVLDGNLVVEFPQLAEIVEQRAGNQQVATQSVAVGEHPDDLHDLEDVFEQAAPVGVMHLPAGRPDPQPLAVATDDVDEQGPQWNRLDGGQPRLELAPHLVDRTGRGRDAVLGPEPEGLVAGNHPPDPLDDQLDPLVEEIATPLDGHELADLELPAGLVGVLEDLRIDLAGDVLEAQYEVRARAAGAPLLAGAQEEAGAGGVLVEADDRRQAGHDVGPVYSRMLESPHATSLHSLVGRARDRALGGLRFSQHGPTGGRPARRLIQPVPSTRPSGRRRDAATLSNDAFARLFTGLQEGIYIGLVGPDETATLAANPHTRLMFGWPDETATPNVRPFDPDRFVDEQARDEFLQRLLRDGVVRDYLLRLRRIDGTAMWAEVTGRAEHLPAGSTARIEAIMRDVTDRKKLQDQARDVYQQLSQAEKLASLGQTMSGVAHELNNPLATILACAERLTTRRLAEATRRDLDAIHNAAERAARIVRNLQTFVRKRHTTRTTVELNQVVRDTLALRAYEQRAANVAIVEALAAGLPPVFVDPHQIQQIVLNLVINAEQAMLEAHGRGTLMLRSWQDPERDAVVLEVSDDGPGVPEEVRNKVFDPFFTTKVVGKGTGLGLTVAYAIAQEHGGRISVRSGEGRGASFLLELPVSGTAVRPAERSAPEALPAVPRGTRALVIEDEPALGDAVAAALADEGFKPDRAEDGEEALRKVAGCHYDVIICDLKMPRVDGIAFFREVSAKTPHIARRLIFVTGDVAGTDAERFLEESGCRWVPKPFRLRDLVRVARETLG